MSCTLVRTAVELDDDPADGVVPRRGHDLDDPCERELAPVLLGEVKNDVPDLQVR